MTTVLKKIDDADLLIAAQCIVGGHTLVTHNVRHFIGIDGLKIEDWAAEQSSFGRRPTTIS